MPCPARLACPAVLSIPSPIACDGIWDVMSSEEVVNFVGIRFDKVRLWISPSAPVADCRLSCPLFCAYTMQAAATGAASDPVAIASQLVDACLKLNSRDNMTAVVIKLTPAPPSPLMVRVHVLSAPLVAPTSHRLC